MTVHKNDVYLENEGAFLFTVELTSTPQMGSFFEYTPDGNLMVTYKVEKVTVIVNEFIHIPNPPDPGTQGFSQSVKVEVSVVP